MVALAVLAGMFLAGCPPQTAVTVSPTTLNFSATDGEKTFQVWNAGTATMDFTLTVPADKGWIQITKVEGGADAYVNDDQLSGGGTSTGPTSKVTVTVKVDRTWSEKAITLGTGTILVASDAGGNAEVVVTTEPEKHTYQFSGGFSANGKTIAFVPDGSLSYYAAQQAAAATNKYPTDISDPSDRESVEFPSDSDWVEAATLRGLGIPFYGEYFTNFFIGAGGSVSFAEPGAALQDPIAQHFALPQITGLSAVDATAGGNVYLSQDFAKVAVTYHDVPTAGDASKLNRFQIEMFFNGEVHLTYLEVLATSGLLGLSAGNGSASGYTTTDISGGTNLPPYNTSTLKAAAY